MTHVALELGLPAARDFRQRPVAVRASNERIARNVLRLRRDLRGSSPLRVELGQQRRYAAQLYDMIDRAAANGARRHVTTGSRQRILRDGYTATSFDDESAHGSAVERACQHDRDHATTVNLGGRAKQRVYGWAVSIFARAAHDRHVTITQQQVVPGGCDVDTPMLDAIAVEHLFYAQRSRGTEDTRKATVGRIRLVQHYE